LHVIVELSINEVKRLASDAFYKGDLFFVYLHLSAEHILSFLKGIAGRVTSRCPRVGNSGRLPTLACMALLHASFRRCQSWPPGATRGASKEGGGGVLPPPSFLLRQQTTTVGPFFHAAQDGGGGQVVELVGSLPVGGRRRVATPAARGGQIRPLTVDWKAPMSWMATSAQDGGRAA
jgi:hypothetical protein